MEGTVDGLGRIAIPEALRDRLGLVPGSRVRLEAEGDRLLVEPTPQGRLTWDENGMPLLHMSIPPDLDLQGIIDEARVGRSEEILGWKPS